METIRVKEEVIEEDTDQMTVAQFYLFRRNTSDSYSPPMIKQRKLLETRKKPEWTMKRPSSLTCKTKQLIPQDMEKYATYNRSTSLVNQFNDHLEAESPVMERAKEIQANLAPEFPSFIKTMLHSHVNRGFLLRLPREFCYLHLPSHDTTVHLVNESGEKYMVKFLLERTAMYSLSGGWRIFSIANKLLEGDVLVFQLVKPFKFKVYIVRANGSDEIDGAPFPSTFGGRQKVECEENELLSFPLQKNSVIPQDMEKYASYNRRSSLVNQFHDHLEAESPVTERAKEIQVNLAPEFPTFIKTMLHSHVTRGFLVKLPKEFCYLHLPRHDATVHLINESGEKFMVKLLAERAAQYQLSGGWRIFSTANKLLEGDVLVFQLVKPFKFKVYIVRANGPDEVDGALGLLNLDSHANRVNLKERIVRPLPMNIVKQNIQQNSPIGLTSDRADQSEIDSEDLGPDTSGFFFDFKEVGSIKYFTLFVNGSIVNSMLSEYHRTKYYELCCTQNSFLHNHLHKTIKSELGAEIISQTVNIADAIRACKVSTSPADYSTWDNILEGFELLGMDVGFLRAKISRLLSLSFESKEAVDSKRFREARLQKSCTEDEITTLELKLLGLKLAAKKLEIEMETLRRNADRHELMFQEEVNAPW